MSYLRARRPQPALPASPARNLVNHRTKRIFDEHAGARCGSHTKPFALPTYKRHTGDVMHDLAVPI